MSAERTLVTRDPASRQPRYKQEKPRRLPELLWLGYLGVTLYWGHDRSPHQHKTRLLIDRWVPLADRLIGLSRLRVLRPVTRELTGLIRALRH